MANTNNIGQYRPGDFIRLLIRYGRVPEAWYRDNGPCPNCNDPVSGWEPNNACHICKGVGHIIADMAIPTSGKSKGRIIFNLVDLKKTKAPVELTAGDLTCIYLPEDFPFAEGDKLLLPSRTGTIAEERKRGEADSETLARWPIVAVSTVYTASGIVAPTAYTLSADKKQIVWGVGAPAEGTAYTIRYSFRPTFYILAGSFSPVEETPAGGIFPQQCILRLWKGSPTDYAEGVGD